MSSRKFLHDLSDFPLLIEQVARLQRVPEQLVEKDYWLMHALWGLKGQGFKFDLKGGTSLSKGFQVIDRFSEDIDIKIEPPEFLNVKDGKNQDKATHVKSRLDFYDWLTNEIDIPGIKAVRDRAFDDDKGRNGGIRLNYSSAYSQLEGVKTFVLLEVGFDVTTPNKPCEISSWVFDAAIKVGLETEDNRAKQIACYLPGYTFVEKLQAISSRHLKAEAGKILPVNFIRHYYDVYQLLRVQSVLDFIGTSEYHAHKKARFRDIDEPNISKNEAFILSNPATREVYAREYQRTQALYYGEAPTFDQIIEKISALSDKL